MKNDTLYYLKKLLFSFAIISTILCLGACSESGNDGEINITGAPTALFGEWTGTELGYGFAHQFSIVFRSDGTGYYDFSQLGNNALNKSPFTFSYSDGELRIQSDKDDAFTATMHLSGFTSMMLTLNDNRYTLYKTRTQKEVEKDYDPKYSSTLRMVDNISNLYFTSSIHSYRSFSNFIYVNVYNDDEVQVRFSPVSSWMDFSIIDNGIEYDPTVGKYGHQYCILLGTNGNMSSPRSCKMYFFTSKDEIGPINITQEGSDGGGAYNVSKVECSLYIYDENGHFVSSGKVDCYKWVDSAGNTYLCKSATDFSTRMGSGKAQANTDTEQEGGASVALYKYRVDDRRTSGTTYYYYFD